MKKQKLFKIIFYTAAILLAGMAPAWSQTVPRTTNLELWQPADGTLAWGRYWRNNNTLLDNLVIQGPSVSVANQVMLFDGTTGKKAKAASLNGIAKLTAGVLSAAENGIDLVPPGTMSIWPTNVAPAGYLLCNGASYLRSAYPSLAAALMPTIGTVTCTSGANAVFTTTVDHNLLTAGTVSFVNTGGSLPAPIAANTIYYIHRINATTFHLATNWFNAAIGTYITTSGTGTGVHYLIDSAHGFADSTHFNVPDMAGRFPLGSSLALETENSVLNSVGYTGGELYHTLTTAELPAHSHTVGAESAHTHTTAGNLNMPVFQTIENGVGADIDYVWVGTTTYPIQTVGGTSHTHSSASVGSGTAFCMLPQYRAVKYIIKY